MTHGGLLLTAAINFKYLVVQVWRELLVKITPHGLPLVELGSPLTARLSGTQ